LIDAVNSTLGVLGLLGQIAAAGLLVAVVAAIASPRVRARLVTSWSALQRQALWAAWGVAVVATAGSLFFSEVADYIPCQLCWYQRICMYPLAVTLLVGALVRDRLAALYSLVFPLVGIAVAARHIYIEANPEAESASCKVGAPCSTKWIEEFGYITIPVLALTAFVLILILAGIALIAGLKADRGGPPDTD